MNRFLAVLLCFGLVGGMTLGLVGCTDKKPSAAKTVTIKGTDKVSVKQGESGSATVTVGLSNDLTKGAKLTADVKDAKDGKADDITVKLDPEKVDKNGDSKVNIAVGEKAATGDYTVAVTATAEGAGAPATHKINLTVVKK